MPQKLAGHEAEIVSAYQAGESTSEIAGRYEVCRSTIANMLTRAGVPLRSRGRAKGQSGPSRSSALAGHEEEVCRAYRAGASLSALERRFKTSEAKIKEVLAGGGVPIRRDKGGRPSRARELVEQAREIAIEGITDPDGCERMCTYRPARYAAGSALEAPPCGRPVRVFAGGSEEALCDLHASMAKDYGLSAEVIAVRMRQTMTQSCALCGDSWETSLLRAPDVWAAHVLRCRQPAARTTFDWNEAERLYVEEGMTLRGVGDQLGVTESAVHLALKSRGVPRRAAGRSVGSVPTNRRIDPDAAIALYAEGLSCEAIGDRLGVSSSSVHACLRSRGIEMRPAGWSDETR